MTKAKAKRAPAPNTFDLARQRIAALAAAMPRDVGALIEIARAGIAGYHAAALSGDAAGMTKHGDDVTAAVRSASFALNTYQLAAADQMRPYLEAKPGEEPMWGQPGRWVIEIAGCRADFHYGGLLDYLGNAAHVIDLEKPFISETGFRSFVGLGHGDVDGVIGTGGLSPSAWFSRACAEQCATDMNGKRMPEPRLVMVTGLTAWRGKEKIDHPYRHPADDPAWQPGGHLYALRRLPSTEPPRIVEERGGQFGFAF